MLFFIVLLLGLISGIILTLVVQWHLFNRYLLSLPCQKPFVSHNYEYRNAKLPEQLLKCLDSPDSKKKESCLCLNLLLQFLFKELRDTIQIKRWFLKKLSVEFEELLQRTTTGKLLEQIMVQDLFLGNQFPVIKTLSLNNIQMHESGHIEELDVLLDVDYMGGFQLSIIVDMVLGKSAFLSVKVARLQGQARLQLTRIPYTHWSFAFFEEPVMDFQVESHFQGRPLPQITSLIINQIRRTDPPSETKNVHILGNKITEGVIDVTVLECTRLFKSTVTSGSLVYCTLALDTAAWVDLFLSCNTSWVARDMDIVRQPNHPVGITFKQEFVLDRYEHCIVVETVAPNSPANTADIQPGDILVAVNSTKIASTGQATKLFKQTSDKFTIRIERRSTLKFYPSQESLSRDDDSTSGSHGAGDDDDDSTDSGDKGSPGMKSPLSQSPIKKGNQKPGNLIRKGKGVGDGAQMLKNGDEKKSSGSNLVNNAELNGVVLKRTSGVKYVEDPCWRETLTFEVEDHQKFLNVCVWCQSLDNKTEKQDKPFRSEKDALLGHVSISLMDIAMQCASNSNGMYHRTFQLSPPEPKPLASRNNKLASHPGFDGTLCYGDITLAFVYQPQPLPKRNKTVTKVCHRDSGPESDDEGFSILSDLSRSEDDWKSSEHDFIITQFQTTVMCLFCSKKVWLKMAFQCRSCGIVCHKKCVAKCQAATSCSGDGNQMKTTPVNLPQPAITTELAPDDPVHSNTDVGESSVSVGANSSGSLLESPRTQRRLRSLLSNLAAATRSTSNTHSDGLATLPRTGSVHNLAIPSQQSIPLQSKSLPPSPQASPAVSRKASLQGNLFQVGHDSEPEEDLDTTVQRLLQFSNDEMLVLIAKEKGKELFTNLSLEERKEKLNSMITKVQCEIDLETENRNDLARKERQTTDLGQKAKISLQIAKSDEKIQAVAILMLYYYSGLQYCQELEDSLKTQAEKIVGIEADKNICKDKS